MGAETPESVELLGGTLALDFVNTVDREADGAHAAPDRTDVLSDADTLRRWARRVGVVQARCRRADPDEVARVRAVREVLYRTFAVLAHGGTPRQGDIADISAQVSEATASGTLARDGDRWVWGWPSGDPRRVRYAVVLDAARLLQDPASLARLSRCPGRRCGWLFLDHSGRRRWCSMRTCGSRDKMRRLYARQRRADQAPT